MLTRCLLVLGLASFLASGAHAQAAGGSVIGVLDLDRILRESEAAKTLRQRIEEHRTAYQAEIRKKEQALGAADQELARQRSVLSAEAFAQKRKELEERAAGLQREFVSRQRELERAFGQGIGQVRTAVIEVSKELALERKLDIILLKVSVLLIVREVDITDEVLKRLNERLSMVEVPGGQGQ